MFASSLEQSRAGAAAVRLKQQEQQGALSTVQEESGEGESKVMAPQIITVGDVPSFPVFSEKIINLMRTLSWHQLF